MELGARWGTWGARAVAMLKVARPGIPHEAGQKTSCQILTSNVIRWSSVISSDILGLTSFVFYRTDLLSHSSLTILPKSFEALFVESMKKFCMALKRATRRSKFFACLGTSQEAQVMHLNNINYQLACEYATPEVVAGMLEHIDFVDLVPRIDLLLTCASPRSILTSKDTSVDCWITPWCGRSSTKQWPGSWSGPIPRASTMTWLPDLHSLPWSLLSVLKSAMDGPRLLVHDFPSKKGCVGLAQVS